MVVLQFIRSKLNAKKLGLGVLLFPCEDLKFHYDFHVLCHRTIYTDLEAFELKKLEMHREDDSN